MVACTRCGDCCREAPCPLAEMAGKTAPCPFLVEDDGVFSCGIYALLPEGTEKDAVGIILGIGRGCSNDYKPGGDSCPDKPAGLLLAAGEG